MLSFCYRSDTKFVAAAAGGGGGGGDADDGDDDAESPPRNISDHRTEASLYSIR